MSRFNRRNSVTYQSFTTEILFQLGIIYSPTFLLFIKTFIEILGGILVKVLLIFQNFLISFAKADYQPE